MVTSAAYRQSAKGDDAGRKADPENKLLWQFPRRRLDGEALRDAMLAVSGRLNLKAGGPIVFPEIPPELKAAGMPWKRHAGRPRARSPQRVRVREAEPPLPAVRPLRRPGPQRDLLAPLRHHHRPAGADAAQRRHRPRLREGLRRSRDEGSGHRPREGGRPRLPARSRPLRRTTRNARRWSSS